MAAAEARRVLIEMAAAKLDAPIADMIVVNGIVQRRFKPRQRTFPMRS